MNKLATRFTTLAIISFVLAWSPTGRAQPRFAAAPGADPAQQGHVRIYTQAPQLQNEIAAFSLGYGANVTFADADADGFDDVIAGAGPGSVNPPEVRGFAIDGTPIPNLDFLAYGSAQWGVNVAGVQIPVDSSEEMITTPGPGPVFGPQVRGFYYDRSSVPPAVVPISKINYYVGGLTDHATLGKGDFDADGWEDYTIALGPNHGFGLKVMAVSHARGQVLFSGYMGGISVHANGGDVDGDGFDELLVGTQTSGGGTLRGFNYDGAGLTPIAALNFYPITCLQCGIIPSAGNLDTDAYDEILASSTVTAGLRAFNYDGAQVSSMWTVKPFTASRGVNHAVSDSSF